MEKEYKMKKTPVEQAEATLDKAYDAANKIYQQKIEQAEAVWIKADKFYRKMEETLDVEYDKAMKKAGDIYDRAVKNLKKKGKKK